MTSTTVLSQQKIKNKSRTRRRRRRKTERRRGQIFQIGRSAFRIVLLFFNNNEQQIGNAFLYSVLSISENQYTHSSKLTKTINDIKAVSHFICVCPYINRSLVLCHRSIMLFSAIYAVPSWYHVIFVFHFEYLYRVASHRIVKIHLAAAAASAFVSCHLPCDTYYIMDMCVQRSAVHSS